MNLKSSGLAAQATRQFISSGVSQPGFLIDLLYILKPAA